MSDRPEAPRNAGTAASRPESGSAHAAASSLAAPSGGYWQIVWRQFRRHRPAVLGLGMVVTLFLLAVFAPFLANRLPYFWYSESEGLTFPLFRALGNNDLIILLAFAFAVLVPVTRRILRRIGWSFWELHDLRRAIVVNLALSALSAATLVNLSLKTWDFPPLREFVPYHMGIVLLAVALLLVRPTRWGLARLVERGGERELWFAGLAINLLTALVLECFLLKAGLMPVLDLMGGAGPVSPTLVAGLVLWITIPVVLVAAVALAGKTRQGLKAAFMTEHLGAFALALNMVLFLAAALFVWQYPFPPVEVPVWWTLTKWQVVGLLAAVLLALVPLTLWRLRRSSHPAAQRRWIAAVIHAYAILLVVLFFTDARIVPSRIFTSRTVEAGGRTFTIRLERDYRREAAEGAKADYLFPPIRNAPTDILAGAKFERPSAEHLLGTDRLGRDSFARIIFGTRVSLAVGFIAVGLSVAIGVLVGGISGYFGGWVDLLLQRFVEIFICFPGFFLMLTIIALWGPKLWIIMIVIGIVSWTGTARFIRAEILKVKSLDYVTAARALGLRPFAIIMRHAMPNSIAPVLVSATFGIASAVSIEVTLSFLGLGDPDQPSWGLMLKQARDVATVSPSLLVIPGVTIFFAVLAYNLVGEGLRDAIDPRLKV